MSGYIMLHAVLLLQFSLLVTMETEPLCLSKYDYDYKVLSKLVELEQKQTQIEGLIKKQDEVIQQQEKNLQQYHKETEDKATTLEDRLDTIESTERPPIENSVVSGSTYVRWGRTECPGNGTETVYSGYAGGSHYADTGAAVNYLCLPSDPLWGQYDDSFIGHSYVYGAEYEIGSSISNKLFQNNLHNNDVPCAVCRSTRVSSLMIPGRNACYGGWTMEYTGYLVAGYKDHGAATEYVCLDKDPEVVPGGDANLNGKLFHLSEAKCGSLKCPPYVDGRELTCSVCTR